MESPKKTTRLSPAAGGGSWALAARYWLSSAKSVRYTSALARRHSSRWRAAADVGGAASCRAEVPHESTAQVASAAKVAAAVFVVIRPRIDRSSSLCAHVGHGAAAFHARLIASPGAGT